MSGVNMTEIWDLVDINGIPVGVSWPRSDHANIPEGCYHPCVEVWVRVRDKILITQRHPSKSEGLKYDSPGGAVVSGEKMIEGAIRELAEEIGVYALPENLKYLGAVIGKRAYAASYLLVLDEMPSICIQPEEVVGYKMVTKSELEVMLNCLCEGCRRRYLMFKDKIF